VGSANAENTASRSRDACLTIRITVPARAAELRQGGFGGIGPGRDLGSGARDDDPAANLGAGSMKVLAVDDGFVAFQRLVGGEAIGRATAEVA